MSIEAVIGIIFVSGIAVAAIVHGLKFAFGAVCAWRKRPVPSGMRWIWRPLAIVVGGLWGLALGDPGWPWGVAAGLGGGFLSTSTVAAAKARLQAMGGRSEGDVPRADDEGGGGR
jgi:hypothetical protein